MTQINPYLTFKGNCEEAFNFYRSVFGGDFTHVNRFKEMPPNEDYSVPKGDMEKIMHISLFTDGFILMGSDTLKSMEDDITVGNNISISINTESYDETKRIFEALSAGGTVMMSLEKTFWGAYFAMFTDKFGIQWMLNYDIKE